MLDAEYASHIAQRAGNELAASDLYGLGIRIGVYLQAISLIFNTTLYSRSSRQSQVLPGAVIVFAMLCSHAVLHTKREIAPAESIVITSLELTALFPGFMAMAMSEMNEDSIGLLLTTTAMTFVGANALWFWKTGYRVLPRYDTTNLTLNFLFKPTPIDGSFRSAAYGLDIFLFIIALLVFIIPNIYRWQRLVRRFLDGKEGKDSAQLHYFLWLFGLWLNIARARIFFLVLSVAYFCVTIVVAEKTILLNGLEPNKEISSPGQIIPLITGLLSLLDSLLYALKSLVQFGRSVVDFQEKRRRWIAEGRSSIGMKFCPLCNARKFEWTGCLNCRIP